MSSATRSRATPSTAASTRSSPRSIPSVAYREHVQAVQGELRLRERYKDEIIVQLPVNGKPTDFDITKEMKEACEIIVDPILEGIHKLVATFNPEFQERIRNNIILGGGGSLMRGLNKRIEDGTNASGGGGKVTVVEEPIYAGANGGATGWTCRRVLAAPARLGSAAHPNTRKPLPRERLVR